MQELDYISWGMSVPWKFIENFVYTIPVWCSKTRQTKRRAPSIIRGWYWLENLDVSMVRLGLGFPYTNSDGFYTQILVILFTQIHFMWGLEIQDKVRVRAKWILEYE